MRRNRREGARMTTRRSSRFEPRGSSFLAVLGPFVGVLERLRRHGCIPFEASAITRPSIGPG
eukprot:3904822-Pyramimonas_sp.AAC.1